MKNYNQLNQIQRYQIEILKKAGNNQKEIAILLGVAASTISRELKRNRGKKRYRPKQAQTKADGRRRQAPQTLKMTPALIAMIEGMVLLDWSPEQISGTLRKEQDIAISHERIYQHIWTDKLNGGMLYRHLRHSGKKRRQYGSKRTSGGRSGIVSALMTAL